MSDLVSQADLDALEAGVDQLLSRIQALLEAKVYAENLPVIGSQLSQAQNALQAITQLKTAIHDAIDAVSNLPDLATLTTSEIRDRLHEAIGDALQDLAELGTGFDGLVTTTIDETTGDIALLFDTGRSTTASFAAGDLGMSSLGLAMSGNATAQLAYDFNFKVGVDGTGFYLDTSASNLSLGVDVSLNGLAATTSLGFLNFTATNIADSDPGAGADTLSLDLVTTWNQSGLVRDFAGDLLNVTASGDLDLDIHLAANMGDAALPSISSNLHVDWNFNQNLLNGTGANSWNPATVTFDEVEYDFGSYVENFVTPLLEQLDPVLGPINDALAVLRTDISGILLPEWADLLDVVDDDKVTALDFLQLASNAAGLGIDFGPLAQVIDLVDTIVDVVEFFRGRDFADAGFEVGDYQFQLQQMQGAVDTLAGFNIGSGTFTGANVDVGTFIGGLSGLAGFSGAHTSGSTTRSGGELVEELTDHAWLTFAPLENPLSVIQLLLGQDVDLFTFDLPTINIGIGMDAAGNVTTPITAATVPIWPLPLVTGKLNVAMQAVIDLAFGYDTSGLRQYAAAAFSDPTAVLNGFYFDDQRSGGSDIPEIVIRAAVELALDANFAIVSVGGGGNLIGEVALDFADSLFGDDARLYINELPTDFASNPFQIFDVSGRVTAGLRFYVNSVIGNLFNWNSARLTLAEFSFVQGAESAGPPPGLADQSGSELWINIGARAGERDIANKTDGAEYFEIGAGPSGKVVVNAFGATQVFGESEAITAIELDAGNGNDEVVMDAALLIPARMSGGAGTDALTGGGAADQLYGGTEDDWLRGGAGDDELYGEAGNDYLEGGAGADRVDGGEGDYDIATYAGAAAGVTVNLTTGVHLGEANGDSFFGIEIFEGSRHADVMTGSGGTDIFASIEGDDTLNGMGGDDILAPGTGTNTVDGGDGYDIANYYFSSNGITANVSGFAGTVVAGPAGALTIDDTLSGIEQLDGSDFADSMTGGAGKQVFVGAGGADTLDGGADGDVLVGGAGGDSLIGGDGIDFASYVTAAAGVTLSLATGGTAGDAAGDSFAGIENLTGSNFSDTLGGDGSANYIFGGAGDDALGGAGGDDTLEGGSGADSFDGGAGTDDVTYVNSAAGVVVDRRTPGLSTGDAAGDSYSGVEIISGTNFNDTIRGSDATSEAETLKGGAGDDALFGGLGDDLLIGGAGDDDLAGEEGDDTLQGSEGGDLLSGGFGDDTLHGSFGDDVFDGGEQRDRATYFDALGGVRVNLGATQQSLGGMLVAGLTALDGSGGTDTFVAVGGLSTVEDATGSVLADFLSASEGGSRLEGLAGDDELRGQQGDDTLLGGTGEDELAGGSGNDLLEGGAGADALDGGAGEQDMASFAGDGAGVVASLATGSATDGSGSTDSLAGFEWLRGSGHGDQLFGDIIANRIEGLAGDDVIDGGGAGDTMLGGAGDDIYYVDRVTEATGNDSVVEASNEGDDLIRTTVDYGTADFVVPLAENVEDLQLLGSVVFGYGNSANNRLIGNAADNKLDGRQGADQFWGYGGDDTYWFDGWGDQLGVGTAPRSNIAGDGEQAGGGTDTILLTTTNLANPGEGATYSIDVAWGQHLENVFLQDHDRAISLTGNAQNNYLVANNHWQTLIGGDGDDKLNPGSGGGKDIAHGGSGADTLELDWSDVVLYQFDYAELTGDLTGGYSGVFRQGADYNDHRQPNRVDFTGIEHFHLRFGAGNDYLQTGDGNDILHGGGGNDFLSSRKGADDVHGGDGIDRWLADKSDAEEAMLLDLGDSIVSTYRIGALEVSMQSIEMLGQNDANRFQTGSGDDVLVTRTEYHWDFINTLGGNDTVTLAGGKDIVDLGLGNDTLIVDWADVTDYQFDFAELTGSLAGGYSGRFHQGADYNDHRTPDRVDFAGVEHFRLSFGAGNDHLQTGDGDDYLSGAAGNDYLSSRKGVDEIDGGDGIDRWLADKSAAEVDMVVDLTSATGWSYQLPGGATTVIGVEVLGQNADNLFQTGSGNDTVTTINAYEWDFISTNAGNDEMRLFGGKDIVHLGEGTDTLVVDWSDVTDFHFDFAELTGSLAGGYSGRFHQGADYNDHRKPDRVDFTGVEHFVLKFGAGNDTLATGDGNDTLEGNGGNDFLTSGKGIDQVDGGEGSDRWLADKSAATAAMMLDLTAEAGSSYDILDGTGTMRGIEALGADADRRFHSGSGGDLIVTVNAYIRDFIATNDGDDTVRLFGGKDTVDLGEGNDTLVVDWSDVTDYHFDYAELTGTLSAGYSGVFRQGADYDDHRTPDRVDFAGVEHFHLRFGAGNDTFRTGDGDDILYGNGGHDFFTTGLGADTVHGGEGTDRWMADKSQHTVDLHIDLVNSGVFYVVNGVSANVSGIEILGQNDAIRFQTGSGNDTVVTRTEYHWDFISTNAGNDTVTVAGGKDIVDLGVGTDTLIVDWSDVTAYQFDFALLEGDLAAGYSGTFRQGADYNDHRTPDRVDFAGVEHFRLIFGAGNDNMQTGDGNDLLSAGAGNDFLSSRKGIDEIDGGDGTDRWLADKSDATAGMTLDLTSATGSAYALGGVVTTVKGIEVLGQNADNLFKSGSGNDDITTVNAYEWDFIATNAGDDTVRLFGGKDIVRMGDGTDTLVVDWSDTTAYHFDYAELTGDLAGGYSGVFRQGADYNDHRIPDRVEFSGVEHFSLSFGSGNDTLRTGDGNDSLSGGAGNDFLSSGLGLDTVNGGDGNDRWMADKSAMTAAFALDLTSADAATYQLGALSTTVQGIETLGQAAANPFRTGSGDDVIVTRQDGNWDFVSTGAGDDRVAIAGGKDVVDLGAGNDTLVIDWSASSWLLDFSASELTGSLASGYSGRYQNFLDYGDDRQPERVHFSGVEHFDITLGNNGNFVVTGDGNDTLRGGTGGDTMRAAGGVDTVDYSARSAAITVTLNGATDTAVLVNGVHEDTISGFENVIGGSADDVLTGDGLANALAGNAGDDTLKGGGGSDILDGGEGFDTADLTDRTGALSVVYNDDGSVTVLLDGTAEDTLVNVERVLGPQGITVLLGAPGNNAPVVANPLADHASPEDAAVDYQLPADAFSDPDGDTLSYSATLDNGDPLPGWLSFDGATRTFSGTPPLDFNGTLAIEVTASDGSLTVSDAFDLVITPLNDGPAVSNAIADQASAEDGAVSYQVPEDAFGDVDGDALTYAATLDNGDPLPAWLSFDGATRTFAGTPPEDFNGTLTLKVTASDGELTASDTFELVITPVNDAPTVAEPIADHDSAAGEAVSYQVPADAFSDIDGDTLTYTATLGNDDPLPDWLVFDGATRTFGGTPPSGFEGTLSLKVIANDGELTASDFFDLVITASGAVDLPAVARPDRFFGAESDILVGNLFDDHGFGADFDTDGPALAVSAVDGLVALVGSTYTLESGATVRIEADGTFTYTPGTAFGFLAAPGSGAVNTGLVDTFDYALAGGGTATVTVFVYGVDSADILVGTGGVDNLNAGAFNDILFGLTGPDTLNGGAGIDAASYALDEGAVFVNLTLGRGYGNASFGDTYLSIENVIGTDYDDFLIGDPGVNRLDGAGGNDILIGAVGPDALIGGGGTDWASYEDNSGTVFVNLSLGRGWNNAAHEDTYEGIENLIGGLFDDFFIGDEQANWLVGAMGADTLVGAGGADTFAFTYAPGADSEWGSPNVDTILDFTSGVDTIELAAGAFAGLAAGGLPASAFVLGTAAGDADDRILYDQTSGNLWFDADGSGGGAAVLFAVLDSKPAIAAIDFAVV